VEQKAAPVAPGPANAADPAALSADDSFTRGRDLMKSGDYKGAIQAFGRAVDLRPNWAQAYHGRGDAYEAIEQYDAAIHDYTHAVLLNPVALFLSSRATCYIKMGKDDAALADLNKGIAMNAEGPGMRIARAGIYIRRTEFRQALPDLDEALRVNPDSIPAHRQRAVVRRALGDRPGAQSDAETANRLAATKSGG
jgi:tetratricopeptide (TPR) repeat protein